MEKSAVSLISPRNRDQNKSPFQSFSDFTKNRPTLQMFQELQNQQNMTSPTFMPVTISEVDSPQLLQANVFLSPNPSPRNNLSIQIPQQSPHSQNLQKSRQDSPPKNSKNSVIKIIILLLTLILFAFLLAQQFQFTKLLQTFPKYSSNFPANLQSSLWLKQYQQFQYKQQLKIKQSVHQQRIIPKNMSYFVSQMYRNSQEVKLYLQIETIQNIRRLPFCLFVTIDSLTEQQEIIKSILQTNYQNFMVILPKIITKVPDDTNIQSQYNKDLRIIRVDLFDFNYFTIMSLFSQKCITNSLVMFIRSPVHVNIFHKFNTLHQNWNTYLTYAKRQDSYQVFTFYLRVFELLGLNDFKGSNYQYLKRANMQVWAMGLLQLTALKHKVINTQQIYRMQAAKSTLLVNINNQKTYARLSYQPIKRLSEDYPKNLFRDVQNYKRWVAKLQKYRKVYLKLQNLSLQKLFKALQYQDSLYLPRNHSLSKRQIKHLNSHYNTADYRQNQLPLCICILSHNNIPNNRYKKVLLSITQQQYSNYHIVFFDDLSDDLTIEKTIQYLKQLGFPSERATFIKNLQRKYATYNILNAAFNFCKEDDIQVLVDGDDQLIGWHVFNLINGAYQKYSQKWVIYTNFKTNLYQLGESRPIYQKGQIITAKNKRKGGHFLGQLRTWRTKLVRAIPKIYHEARGGYWLDTVYDDAIQHCLFQLASVQRVLYLPEICYQYNRDYGNNDDSSQQKINNRLNAYHYLLQLPPLEQVNTLQQLKPDAELTVLFQNELQSKTFITIAGYNQQQLNKN